jgi:hypothetical protein
VGLLDGQIAKLVGDALVKAKLSKPIVLVRVTAGPLDPLHPTAASTPTTISYSCQGFAASTASYVFRNTLIANASRIVKVYGSTLLAGVTPAPGDLVTIDGVTSTIVNDAGGLKAVQVDAAGAVWTLQLG